MLPTMSPLALGWLGAVGLSFIGWGRAARRLLTPGPGSWATDAGLGLAALVALGGVLDLARLATRPVLVAVVTLGALLAIAELARVRTSLPAGAAAWTELLLAAALAVGAIGFRVATTVPAAAYNSVDDFQKYLVHPVRMLATGTVAGNPTSAIGAETLGGHAFLHGLVHAVLPLGYVGALDAAVGLAALAALAARAWWRRVAPLPGAAIGVALVLVVEPQIVNVSSLYVGAALLATAFALCADDREPGPSPAAVGLVYAALVASKTSFGLFVSLHAALVAVAVARRRGSLAAGAAWLGRSASWSIAFLAPWIIVHVPIWRGAGASLFPTPPGIVRPPLDLLSAEPLFYGGTAAHYTALAVLAVGVAAAALALDRGRTAAVLGAAAGAATVGAAYLILTRLLPERLNGVEQGLRYSIPVLLAGLAVPLGIAAGAGAGLARRALGSVASLGAVALALAFGPEWVDRSAQALRTGSVLAFRTLATDPSYLELNAWVLAGGATPHMRAVQSRVPAGEPLVAWVGFPFLLDRARNPVFDVEPTSLANPWARFPANVRWAVWEYRGPTIPPRVDPSVAPGEHERRMAAAKDARWGELERLAAGGAAVYDDGGFAVLRLDATR
jgi:hypothetical protein